MMVIPHLRMYEDIICHNYYNSLEGEEHIGLDGYVDEEMCKGDEVQSRLNMFIGVMGFLGTIPGLLTTIPYGLLADRIGRKPVFAFALIGMLIGAAYNMLIMSFWKVLPIYLLCVAPLFWFIGGGPAVSQMMFYAIGCDITTEATRTNIFLYGHGAGLLGNLIAPSVAGGLMAINPWLSIIPGWFIIALGGSIVSFIPETLHMQLSPSGVLVPASKPRSHSPSQKMDKSASYITSVQSQFMDAFKKIRSSTEVLQSLPIVLLLLTFLAEPFGSDAIDISLRYISKRFHWKLREAAFLLSLRAFINLVLVLVVIPPISHFLIKRLGFSSQGKDLFFARFSIIAQIVGTLSIACGSTIGVTITGLIVWTLGTGYTSFARSLITSLVDQQHVGRLYAAVSVIETLGALAAVPSLAALYSVGLNRGGSWISLPFYCVAIICFIAALGVWSFGVLTRKQRGRRDMCFSEEYSDEYAGAETSMVDLVVVEPDRHQEGSIMI